MIGEQNGNVARRMKHFNNSNLWSLIKSKNKIKRKKERSKKHDEKII